MSDAALESQGMELKIGDGASPEVFTKITEVKNFNGPGGTATVIDTSDLDSVAKEKRMGLPDEGQFTFTINYVPNDTQHTALRAARASRALTNFKLLFTDSPQTTWTFAAFVLGFAISGAVDGVVQANVTLEVSGAITES